MNRQGDDYLLFPEIEERGKASRLIDLTMVNLLKEAKAPIELVPVSHCPTVSVSRCLL